MAAFDDTGRGVDRPVAVRTCIQESIHDPTLLLVARQIAPGG